MPRIGDGPLDGSIARLHSAQADFATFPRRIHSLGSRPAIDGSLPVLHARPYRMKSEQARRRTPSYRTGVSLAAAATGLLLFLLWRLPIVAGFSVAPLFTAAWWLVVAAMLLRFYVVPARWNGRARVRSRAHLLPGRAWPWIALTAPAMAALPLALWCVLLALGLGHAAELEEPLEKWLAQPGGNAVLVMYALLMAPLLEELAFRGWVQRPVERRFGAQIGVALSAVLFAAAHGQADYLPVRLAAGLVLGYAVYATRSVWAGVALHFAWNGGTLAFAAAFPDFDPTGKGWPWAGPAAGVALVSLVWCAWGVMRMQMASLSRAGGPGAAAGHPVESS
jgi:membrane protease YdiL (CAAX protease family)